MNALKLRNMTTEEVVQWALTHVDDNVARRLAEDLEIIFAELDRVMSDLLAAEDQSLSGDLQHVLKKVSALCNAS